MKKLTESQINFILDKFFITELYAGARNIGEKLLTNGFCIVAGKTQIHFAPISQFIHTENANEFIDCLKYTLDLEGFLKSQFFKSKVQSHIAKFKREKEKLQTEYAINIRKLIKENEDICKF